MSDKYSFLGGEVQFDADVVVSFCGATPKDAIILAGTVVEGIGNILSDFDICVICEEPPVPTQELIQDRNYIEDTNGKQVRLADEKLEDRKIRFIHDYLTTRTGKEVAFESHFLTFRDVEWLSETIINYYRSVCSATKMIYQPVWLTWQQMNTVNYILSGRVVRSNARFEKLLARFPRQEFLYLLYRNTIGSHPQFKDICGWWQAGQFEWCSIKSREYLVLQISSLLHLLGNANHNIKWVWAKLSLLNTVNTGLAARFQACMLKDTSTHDAQRAVVHECLDLVDDIWLESRRHLDSQKAFLGVETSVRLTEQEFADRPYSSHQLALEREFRLKIYKDGLKRNVEFLDIY